MIGIRVIVVIRIGIGSDPIVLDLHDRGDLLRAARYRVSRR
jgi:hypothetical protein